MKKFLSAAILLSILFFMSCSDDDNGTKPDPGPVFSLVNPDTLVTGSVFSNDELLSYCQVQNNTNEEINVTVRMEVEQLPEGHIVAVCTDICYAYGTQDFTAPGPLVISPNSITDTQEFSGHYNFSSGGGMVNPSTGIIKYVFYLEDDPDEMQEYTCKFIIE